MTTTVSSLELLESRIAPAALYSYLDVDGDSVTVKSSKGNNADFKDIMEAHRVAQGSGFRINEIDLTDVVPASTGEFAKTDLTISVVKGPHGDGRVDLGYIFAGTMPMHSFIAPKASIQRLDCGDGTNAIGKLQIASYGTTAPAYFNNGIADSLGTLAGNVGSIKIAGDIAYGGIAIGNPMMSPTVTVGSIFVGGNLQGNASAATTSAGELIVIAKTTGTIKIGGSILGGAIKGNNLGTVAGSGILININSAKSISIGGDIMGGSGEDSGFLYAGAKTLTIRGSVIGGSGESSGSGFLGAINLTIGGNIQGGTSPGAGAIIVAGAKNVTIKGSILGGVTDTSGAVTAAAGALELSSDVSSVNIGGNLVAGSITAGSVNLNGSILSTKNIQSLQIGGSVLGTDADRAQILVKGTAPAAPDVSFNAIGSLTIGGSIEYGIIASGHDGTNATTLNLGNAENPDAGIGKVTIGGDFYHSSILAGTNDNNGFGAGRFNVGTNYDTQSIGAATRIARLGPVVIKGAILDDFSSGGFSGFEGEQITSITAGGALLFKHGDPLTFFDPNNFVFAQEIAVS